MKKFTDDITGKKFGLLVALRLEKRVGPFNYWSCKCDCGMATCIREYDLRSGRSRTCGCTRMANMVSAVITHGETKNRSQTKEYMTYSGMKKRCYNKNEKRYDRYGGRGIVVCGRWLDSYPNFLSDMGRCPSGMTLDRINNDGNYEPENCRWADWSTQANNTSAVLKLEFNGESKTITQWANALGISRPALVSRIYRGWDVETALTIQVRGQNKRPSLVVV